MEGALYRELEGLPPESVIEIDGYAREDSRAPAGREVRVKGVRVLRRSEEDYPIARKYHGPDFLLDNRHLWIRNEKVQAVLRVRAKLFEAAREWFRENGYTEAHMPILVSSACEGGATLFELKYFDTKAYLTQSWQLYAEATIASLGKIYTIAPSFRAEKSHTRKHLTEYWHIEAEAPWHGLDDVIKTQEELLTHICSSIAQECVYELRLLGRDPGYLLGINPPFYRITYDEALGLLEELGFKVPWGEDFGGDEERALSERFDKPVFVTHFPRRIKAFYHKPDPRRPEVTLSVDLIAPEGRYEISGGGERIDDKEVLLQRLREEGLSEEEYSWYLDLRRYGSVPHAGFGIGAERVIAWICNLDHVRDAITFPRLPNRIYP